MKLLDTRRLAAVDMHGVTGTRRRRRLIRAEFVLGAVGGIGLGVWVAARAGTAAWQLFGAWVAGVGVNYAALAWLAARLSRPGALEASLPTPICDPSCDATATCNFGWWYRSCWLSSRFAGPAGGYGAT